MNIKRLVLGAAAGALAVTGAQAADLPVVVEPVDYVRICDAFGTGFYYIPGTETCLRVAGRVRADYNAWFDTDNDDFDVMPGQGYDDNFEDGYRFRARAYIYLDSRTNTEFGLLRTFTHLEFTQNFGDAGLVTNLDKAFIQFGGLTFGRVQSFYDFHDTYYTAGQFFDPGISDTDTNAIAYTFAFGNGFSASLALEDETERRQGVWGVYRTGGDGLEAREADYQGTRIPDIVGNIRVDQGWGSAQIMAAGHYTDVQSSGPDASFEEDYGFAVGGGVNVNVPFGNGTQVGIQGTYAHGAVNYISPSNGATVDVLGLGDVDLYSDGVFDGNDLELSDAFGIQGGFTTNFTPTVSLAGSLAYAYVDHAEVGDVSLDNQTWNAQGFLGYNPVSGLVLGLGAEFRYVDTDDFGSGSALSTFFRAQRTF